MRRPGLGRHAPIIGRRIPSSGAESVEPPVDGAGGIPASQLPDYTSIVRIRRSHTAATTMSRACLAISPSLMSTAACRAW